EVRISAVTISAPSKKCSVRPVSPESARSSPQRVEQETLFFRYAQGMSGSGIHLATLGHRIRHHRTATGLTLDELGAAVGVAGSQLSLIENGKREPKLSLLQAIAQATGTEVSDLISGEPPNRRAALEIELEKAQSSPLFRQLGIPPVRVTKSMTDET